MAGIRVKPEFEKKVIGFNNSSLPLGKRNDLHLLYETAKRKGHRAHLNMFEEVDEKAIEKSKSDAFLKHQEDKKADK